MMGSSKWYKSYHSKNFSTKKTSPNDTMFILVLIPINTRYHGSTLSKRTEVYDPFIEYGSHNLLSKHHSTLKTFSWS